MTIRRFDRSRLGIFRAPDHIRFLPELAKRRSGKV